jgi:hypothetical protein
MYNNKKSATLRKGLRFVKMHSGKIIRQKRKMKPGACILNIPLVPKVFKDKQAGLLTHASSMPCSFPCLKKAQWKHEGLSAFTVAGPCRIFTGFPFHRQCRHLFADECYALLLAQL